MQTISNYVSVLIAFVTNIIIARHLSPAELGLFAISLALTGLLDALREGGVNAYIIQHKSSKLGVLQSAFTAAVFLSAISAIILFSVAPSAGVFFDAPEITSILWIIGSRLSALSLRSNTHGNSAKRDAFPGTSDH